MGLFIRKPFSLLQAEASASGQGTLRRVLGPIGLVAFGVGVIIGAGLFSITGTVAASYTGPAITLSFVIAAIGRAFAGLCYAEFASMIPVAGSAYTYSYATMGELIAWIIGWDLVLEYTVAAITVSISWSQYFTHFLSSVGINLPHELTACPWDGGIVNLPAAAIVVIMSFFLIRGTRESSLLNNIIVFLKVAVIVVFVVIGWQYINSDNYSPYLPQNTGTLGEFGWSGVFRGAAIVFFAFLGFDAVSTAAQETRNPKRNMPLGILLSLLICTVLYMGFGHVMTGVAHYTDFAGQEGIAPVAIAIDHMGTAGADGTIIPAYPRRLLFRDSRIAHRAKPRVYVHEPRRTPAARLLEDTPPLSNAGRQQPHLHDGRSLPRRLRPCWHGWRNDEHRHAPGVYAGMCRRTDRAEDHAPRATHFPHAFCALRACGWHHHMSLSHDIPACRHLDTSRALDAHRP